MTQKHFVDLAARLKALQFEFTENAWRKMVVEMTAFCAANATGNFKREKFLKACGYSE